MTLVRFNFFNWLDRNVINYNQIILYLILDFKWNKWKYSVSSIGIRFWNLENRILLAKDCFPFFRRIWSLVWRRSNQSNMSVDHSRKERSHHLSSSIEVLRRLLPSSNTTVSSKIYLLRNFFLSLRTCQIVRNSTCKTIVHVLQIVSKS